jgi:hypothetical protein
MHTSLENSYEADEWAMIHKNMVYVHPMTISNCDWNWSMEEVISDLCAQNQVDARFNSAFEDVCSGNLLSYKWDAAHMGTDWSVGMFGISSQAVTRQILPATLNGWQPNFRLDMIVRLSTNSADAGLFYQSNVNYSSYRFFTMNTASINIGYVSTIDGVQTSAEETHPLFGHVVLPINTDMHLTVSVQDQWLSIWCDGKLMGTFWQNRNQNDAAHALWYGYWGLNGRGVTGQSYAYFRDIRIAELNQVRDVWYADRNTSILQALQNWLENRPLKMVPGEANSLIFSLFDVKDGPELFDEDMTKVSQVVTGRNVPTHVRVIGANPWADYWDIERWLVDGTVFASFDIAELETEADCYDRAQRMIRTAKENERQLTLTARIRPWLELEDTIHVNAASEAIDETFVIDHMSWTASEHMSEFEMTLNCRLLVAE